MCVRDDRFRTGNGKGEVNSPGQPDQNTPPLYEPQLTSIGNKMSSRQNICIILYQD